MKSSRSLRLKKAGKEIRALGETRGVLKNCLISRGSALKRIAAVKENMHLPEFVRGWGTTKFPDAAPLVIWALFADTKENFTLRHRGASGLRKIEDSSWSFLYLIISQTEIQWSVENNETDGVEQSAWSIILAARFWARRRQRRSVWEQVPQTLEQ